MYKKNEYKDLILCSMLILIVVFLYWQVKSFTEYTNWDTPTFVINNQIIMNISFENIINIFTPGKIPKEILFIPVTYLSYMLEIGLWGMNISVMHIDNVILHIFNTILLYCLILMIFKNRTAAFFSSLIFAVHPVQVEAVCWIMGRKDLLMAFFSLLSCIFWVKKIKVGKSSYFIFSILFFLLACFSKPTALVVPLLLFAIDYYYGKKGTFIDKIISIVPFLLCAGIVYFINTLVPQIVNYTLPFKALPVLYLPSIILDWCSRIFLFSRGEIVYTKLKGDPFFEFNSVSLLTSIVLLIIVVYIYRKKIKEAVFCMLFLLISLLPTLTALLSKRSIVTADRYGYFPMIGVFVLAGILISYKGSLRERLIKYSIVLIWIVIMIFYTYTLIPVWQTTKTLWDYELSIDEESPFGLNNMSTYYFNKGDVDFALELLLRAEKVANYKDTLYNIAEIYRGKNDIDKAIIYYKKAIKADPDNMNYHGLLGTMYLKKDMLNEALDEFVTVTKLNPDNPRAYLFISEIFARTKQQKRAEFVYGIYEEKKSITEKSKK